MRNTIAFLSALTLLSTAAPALAQEAEIPAEHSADSTAPEPAEPPVITTGPGYLGGPVIAASPNAPTAPPPAAEITPPGIVFDAGPSIPEQSRTSLMRLTGEMATGMATGLGLGVAAGSLVYRTTVDDCEGAFCELGGALVSVAIGGVVYPVGAGLGVALAGNIGDHHGSLKAAIGGAYVGALTGALIGAMTSIEHDSGVPGAMVGYVLGAPLGAAFAFHLSLEPDEPSTGLVNVSGNGARLSIPVVSVTQDPLHPQRTLTSVRLMDGRF